MNEIKSGLTYGPWARIGEISRDKKGTESRKKKRKRTKEKECTDDGHKIDKFA